MNTIIHTYKELYIATIKLYSDGKCLRQNVYKLHTRETINKMACVRVDCDYDLISDLYEECNNTSFSPGSSLYVSSDCKTGRDTFRNSGYSITRSQDKADAIVVPDVRKDFYHHENCNVVAYDEANDALYLFNIDKPGYLITQVTDIDLENIRNAIRGWGYEPDEIQRSNLCVWFISKCEELKDVMQDRMRNIPYIQESRVPLKPSTQFSPETLVFWENVDDMNLLIRTICTSDWYDYPMTLLAFLTCFKGGQNWYNYANNDFRRILKQVGYEGYWNISYVFGDEKYISPKDYEMLQSYLYYKLALGENGGFVSAKRFNATVPDALRRFMKRMIAFKPMSIPTKMKLGSLSELASS